MTKISCRLHLLGRPQEDYRHKLKLVVMEISASRRPISLSLVLVIADLELLLWWPPLPLEAAKMFHLTSHIHLPQTLISKWFPALPRQVLELQLVVTRSNIICTRMTLPTSERLMSDVERQENLARTNIRKVQALKALKWLGNMRQRRMFTSKRLKRIKITLRDRSTSFVEL